MIRVTNIGPYNVGVSQDIAGTSGALESSIWVFEDADARLMWTNHSNFASRAERLEAVSTFVGSPALENAAILRPGVGLPVGDANAIYVRFEDVIAFNPVRGNTLWRERLGEQDAERVASFPATGQALAPGVLYTTSYQTLYAYSLGEGGSGAVERWNHPITGDATYGTIVAADDVVLARIHYLYSQSTRDPRNTWIAFDLDGEPLWDFDLNVSEGDWPAPPGHAMFTSAPAAGNLVISGVDGTVRLLGRTSASMDARADITDTYPAVGETVVVDLGDTRAGAQGAATRFRAHWGDGTTSEWQSEPRFEHVYERDGEYLARFEAANDAGQSSSTTATMAVGGSPPTLMQTWFARENQDLTFFVIGLILTLLGILWGLARVRRRRSILTRELGEVDAAFEATKARPLDCEATLAERKARARGLLTEHKLTETEFQILAHRIDELARGRRVEVIDAELAFLPHSLHEFLREMLADGRISRWEREHFAQALERDTLLTREQKMAVMARVDAWLSRDAR